MSVIPGITRRGYSLCKDKVRLQIVTVNLKVRAVNDEPLANLPANAVRGEVSTGAVSTRENAWPN